MRFGHPTMWGPAVLISAGFAANAAAQSPLWQVRYDDIAFAFDQVNAVTSDASGNSYLVGYDDTGWAAWKVAADGRVLWHWHHVGLLRRDEEPRLAGRDEVGNLFLVSGSSYGISIARVSPEGETGIVRHYPGQPNIADATVTPAGELYLVGSVSTDPFAPTDIFVAKYDSNGEQLWSQIYDGPAAGYDSATAVAIGQSGDLYVVGQAAYRTPPMNVLGYGAVVLRYSPTGELIWSALTRLNPNDPAEHLRPATIAIDSAGSVYVAGCEVHSSQCVGVLFKVGGDGTPGWIHGPLEPLYTTNLGRNPRVLLDEAANSVYFACDVPNSPEDSDLVLRSYALDGSDRWVARYDGPAHARDNLLDACLDGRGVIHLIGTSYAEADNPDLTDVQFNSAGQQILVGRSDNDATKYDRVRVGTVGADGSAWIVGGAFEQYFDSRLVRLDPTGQVSWTTLLQSTVSSVDEFSSAAADPSGGIYVIGTSDRQRAENSAILARYDPRGILEWQTRLPLRFYEPGALLVDPAGNAIIVSLFANNQSAAMGLLKFDAFGTLLWSANFTGPAQLTWLRGRVAMDPTGGLVICGSTNLNSSSNAIITSVGGDGELRWTQYLSGIWDESFDALDIGNDGAITVVGNSSQYEYNTPREIVTMRFSGDGQELWRSRFSSPDTTDSDAPRSVRVAADGSAFVAATRGSWPGPTWVTILNYSDSGELLWDRDFRGSTGESVWAGEARIDTSGNFLVVCVLQGLDRSYDTLTLCYQPDGNLLWSRRQPGPRNYSEEGRFFEPLAGGDFLISADTFRGSSYQYYNSMLVRQDSEGIPRWVSRRVHPNALSGQVVSIVALPDGGFVTAGATSSPNTRTDAILTRYSPPPVACNEIDPCAGDLNGDCRVDLSDLAQVLSSFGTPLAFGLAPANGDADFDGDIDIQDLVIVLSGWASPCE